jgi:hypothetical protein
MIFKFPNSTQNCKFIKEAFPSSKNMQTLQTAIFEYVEELSPLGQLQIPNKIVVINSGTGNNFNLP